MESGPHPISSARTRSPQAARARRTRRAIPAIFTAFVSNQQGARTPDAVLFGEAWNSLQAALGRELKRRGLWQSPPCYLGVYGYERWDAEETIGDPMSRAWGRTRPGQSALGELVADCWAFIFSDRMVGLKRQLEAKANIDGLVLLNIRHFLHERQREHDPVGFRIFERLESAVREAVARRRLHVLAGDPRVRNNTVLGFDPAARPQVTAFDLAPVVARWNDELLPDLVIARGRQEAEVVDRLESFLLELPRQGVDLFRFKDLVDPLKNDGRLRWAAFLAREGPAAAVHCSPVGVPVLPESSFESRQSFDHLTRCVTVSIRRAEVDPRTRGYLATLWRHLHHQQMDGAGSVHATPDPDRSDAPEAQSEEPLSYRQLGLRLEIPRERIPMLLATLKQLVERCRLTGKVQLDRRSWRARA